MYVGLRFRSVINYGSGSDTEKSYGSYGFSSATLPVMHFCRYVSLHSIEFPDLIFLSFMLKMAKDLLLKKVVEHISVFVFFILFEKVRTAKGRMLIRSTRLLKRKSCLVVCLYFFYFLAYP